ncbi:MAG: NAD(P)-dependent oxidoreductase [Burkholderiales bacterium]|nr:NAD(P)-dependent oxidoreductase [Burkholderiales bacterium]
MKIGFIGLGRMGRGMAARLIDGGHELTLYNRTRAAAEPFRARGARVVESAAAALQAEVIITMLADDAALEAAWVAGGLAGMLPPGAVHLNMGTVGVPLCRRMAALHAARGNPYVAAPVLGRPHVAALGELDIVAAGPAAATARCRPLFDLLGARTFVVGEAPHAASAVKIARNFLLASLVESLGEALALVRKCGGDPALFLDVITTSSFDRRYRDYGNRMVQGNFEPAFPLRLGLKDVELALQAAAGCGVALPTAELIRERHLAAIEAGYGEKDWAALGEYIARQAGLAR